MANADYSWNAHNFNGLLWACFYHMTTTISFIHSTTKFGWNSDEKSLALYNGVALTNCYHRVRLEIEIYSASEQRFIMIPLHILTLAFCFCFSSFRIATLFSITFYISCFSLKFIVYDVSWPQLIANHSKMGRKKTLHGLAKLFFNIRKSFMNINLVLATY